MSQHFSKELSRAVLQAMLYSDVFDFPLTAHEIHRNLPGVAASYDNVYQAMLTDPRFVKKADYFTLVGREDLVSLREQRQLRAKQLLPYALAYGRIIGSLPFVRMVALTGSLAVRNISRNVDFDYMLVTRPGRLWTARAFVLLFGRFTKLLGHTICPNLIVSENSLEWHPRDLYSAHEFCQMIPITGRAVYRKLMHENAWIKDFLPNAYRESGSFRLKDVKELPAAFGKLLESPLRGNLGERFERWEMKRKIARFSQQAGFGEETIFTADVCQGNFDHHRRWTEEQLQLRIHSYDADGLRVT